MMISERTLVGDLNSEPNLEPGLVSLPFLVTSVGDKTVTAFRFILLGF